VGGPFIEKNKRTNDESLFIFRRHGPLAGKCACIMADFRSLEILALAESYGTRIKAGPTGLERSMPGNKKAPLGHSIHHFESMETNQFRPGAVEVEPGLMLEPWPNFNNTLLESLRTATVVVR
jgi:hypothetical protein